MDGSPRSTDEIMENQTSFDLSSAIQTWRQNLEQSEAFSPADLDELEAHLHDAMPALLASGLSSEESFLIAARRIGPRQSLVSEFGKIRTGQAWLNRPWQAGVRFAMVFMILALVGVGIAIETARQRSTSDLPVAPVWSVFPGMFGVLLVVTLIFGGIGYVVLRVVSRSGSERLANIHTWPQKRQ